MYRSLLFCMRLIAKPFFRSTDHVRIKLFPWNFQRDRSRQIMRSSGGFAFEFHERRDKRRRKRRPGTVPALVVFHSRISIPSAGGLYGNSTWRARLPRTNIEFERILMGACIILREWINGDTRNATRTLTRDCLRVIYNELESPVCRDSRTTEVLSLLRCGDSLSRNIVREQIGHKTLFSNLNKVTSSFIRRTMKIR